MATAFILIGSLGSFAAAIASYLVLDAHPLTALSIWVLGGPLSATVVLLANLPYQTRGPRESAPVSAS